MRIMNGKATLKEQQLVPLAVAFLMVVGGLLMEKQPELVMVLAFLGYVATWLWVRVVVRISR